MIDNKLKEIYMNWENKFDKDEWYFQTEFDKILNNMTSQQAFDYIPNVVATIIELEVSSLLWETIYFLIALYEHADTTEIHPFLKEKWLELDKHIADYKDSYETPFQELKRGLRIK